MKFTIPYFNNEVELDKRDLVISTISAAFVCGTMMAAYQVGSFWYNAPTFGSMGLWQAGIGLNMTAAAAAGGALVMGAYKTATVPVQMAKQTTKKCTDKICKALGIAEEEKPAQDAEVEAAPKAKSKAITPALNASRSEGGNTYNNCTFYNGTMEETHRGRSTARSQAARSKTPTRAARSRSTARK
ncbi:MAG: hypothetical protein AB7I18_12035 [Candidatus Berkiella sp.]